MKCKKCNAEIPDGSTFCNRCGAVQNINLAPCPAPTPLQVQPLSKHRTVYIILGWYFGTFGVHNFYAERIGCAVSQLLMTLLSCGLLTPVTWLWSFIEILTVRQSRGQRMKPATWWIVLLAIGLPFILNIAFTTLTLTAISTVRDKTQYSVCINHLKQYNICIRSYMDDNSGTIPGEEDLRREKYISRDDDNDTKSWIKCPASGSKYVILGAGEKISSYGVHSQVPIVIERPGSHKYDRINVLFLDGHIDTVYLPRTNMSLKEAVEYILDTQCRDIGNSIRNKLLEDAEAAE